MTWEYWAFAYLFVGAFLTLDFVIESPPTYLSFVGLKSWKRSVMFLLMAALTPAITVYAISKAIIQILVMLVTRRGS